MNDETEVPREGRVPIIRNRSTISLEHDVIHDNIKPQCWRNLDIEVSILTTVNAWLDKFQ